MSNSTFVATHTDLNASNPSHSNMIPHLHDHPHQTPSPLLTANSFIGTPPPEDKLDHVFQLLCGNPNGINLGSRGGDFTDYCKERYRFHADTYCLYEHNLDSYNPLQGHTKCVLTTPNLLQPAVLSQLHLPLDPVQL